MKKEQELELKNTISEIKYHELMIYFLKQSSKKNIYIQTNFYFDDSALSLKKSKITFRIRKKEIENTEQWELTAKLPHKKNQSKEFNLQTEYNLTIDKKTALFCLQNGISKETPSVQKLFSLLVKECNLSDSIVFTSIGHLKTVRTDFFSQNEVISLDQSFYNGIVDWEIEWETSFEKLHIAKEKWLSLDLSLTKSKGKKNRFFETL